jgi:hypothetical protein
MHLVDLFVILWKYPALLAAVIVVIAAAAWWLCNTADLLGILFLAAGATAWIAIVGSSPWHHKCGVVPFPFSVAIYPPVPAVSTPSPQEAALGLPFSLEYMNAMQTKIMGLPAHKQTEFADRVVRDICSQYEIDPESLADLGVVGQDDKHHDRWNAASVGNLAYIIMNCTTTPFAKVLAWGAMQQHLDYCHIPKERRGKFL